MARAVAFLASVALLPACGTTGAASGPGRLDANIVKAAATLDGAEKLELRADAAGTLQKIALYHRAESRVPEAVRALVQATLPGAKVKKYELEVYADGKPSHEVEVDSADGTACEVSATAEGQLRYLECTVKPEALPPAVAQAVAARLPGGAILEAESHKGPGVDDFSVEVKVGERVHELRLSPGGEVRSHHLVIPATVEVAVD